MVKATAQHSDCLAHRHPPPSGWRVEDIPAGASAKSPAPGSAETTEPGAAPDRLTDAGEFERALALGFRLLNAAEAIGFSFSDLGDIDLPPVVGSDTDQASLRAAAPLYLASELESALLLPAVETLAGLYASGAIPVESGEAPRLLTAFWRGRNERFTAPERAAFFTRLFGGPGGAVLAGRQGRNDAFEHLMIDLTEALLAFGQQTPVGRAFGAYEESRVRTAASQLAANLIPRSGGMIGFAARDILETTQRALEILKQPEVQRVLGARSVWMAVRGVAQRYLSRSPDIASHVVRGKSGLLVLAWLAEALPRLSSLGPALVEADDTVIGAATAWLQASLSLAEAGATAGQGG